MVGLLDTEELLDGVTVDVVLTVGETVVERDVDGLTLLLGVTVGLVDTMIHCVAPAKLKKPGLQGIHVLAPAVDL